MAINNVDIDRLVDTDSDDDEEEEDQNQEEHEIDFVVKNYRKEYDMLPFCWKCTYNTLVMIELLISLVIVIAAFKK